MEAGEVRVAADKFLGERGVRRGVESALLAAKNVRRDTNPKVGGEGRVFLAAADVIVGSPDNPHGVADALLGAAPDGAVAGSRCGAYR